ncbi:unnamed protein product [Amoebophrya sp. A120]|nr:unnamed protein product [Amoebophrya sp. A120]|eukprot:GSA120T00021139001.1
MQKQILGRLSFLLQTQDLSVEPRRAEPKKNDLYL